MAKTRQVPDLPPEDRAESLLEWARTHSRTLSIGAISVVAIAALAWLWRSAAEKKELNASRSLAEAQGVFASGNLALAQSDLRRLTERYDGTKAAIQGRLLLAQTFLGQGMADSGLAVLRTVRDAGPFGTAYHAVYAAALEQDGKPGEAAAQYLLAAEASVSDPEGASHRADAARAYVAAGDLEAARRIWEAMASSEANPLAGEARLRLGELSIKPVTGG
jgi:predicted negative regulator of RcsB-dependent stress response